jgi:uncharacterized protein with HEPN domain
VTHSRAEFLRDAREMASHASTCSSLDAETLPGAKDARFSVVYCLIRHWRGPEHYPGAASKPSPDIPWRSIIAMRNVLIHAHWQTDYTIVHEVVRRDLDPLTQAIDRLLPFVEQS